MLSDDGYPLKALSGNTFFQMETRWKVEKLLSHPDPGGRSAKGQAPGRKGGLSPFADRLSKNKGCEPFSALADAQVWRNLQGHCRRNELPSKNNKESALERLERCPFVPDDRGWPFFRFLAESG